MNLGLIYTIVMAICLFVRLLLSLTVTGETAAGDTGTELQGQSLPPKVIEVYSALGKMLKHYKSGKLPKALKMLPHLKNWEEILWLTRPDEWYGVSISQSSFD